MQTIRKLYNQLSYDILHILFSCTQIFDSLKKNKRIRSVRTVNSKFKSHLDQVLKGLQLSEYVCVICISNFNEGNLEIDATLTTINEIEYSKFFVEKFHRLKEFIAQNKLTIVYDPRNKCYSLEGTCGTFRYDDDEVIKVLYLEDKLTGFLADL